MIWQRLFRRFKSKPYLEIRQHALDALEQIKPDVPASSLSEPPHWLVDNLVEASKNARSIFYLYLGFSAYLLLTVVGTTNKQLLIGDKAQLPIINMQIPLIGFFVTAPMLLIVIFAYFQLYLLRIQSLRGDLHNFKPLNSLHSIGIKT
jgi:hypothetical protein